MYYKRYLFALALLNERQAPGNPDMTKTFATILGAMAYWLATEDTPANRLTN